MKTLMQLGEKTIDPNSEVVFKQIWRGATFQASRLYVDGERLDDLLVKSFTVAGDPIMTLPAPMSDLVGVPDGFLAGIWVHDGDVVEVAVNNDGSATTKLKLDLHGVREDGPSPRERKNEGVVPPAPFEGLANMFGALPFGLPSPQEVMGMLSAGTKPRSSVEKLLAMEASMFFANLFAKLNRGDRTPPHRGAEPVDEELTSLVRESSPPAWRPRQSEGIVSFHKAPDPSGLGFKKPDDFKERLGFDVLEPGEVGTFVACPQCRIQLDRWCLRAVHGSSFQVADGVQLLDVRVGHNSQFAAAAASNLLHWKDDRDYVVDVCQAGMNVELVILNGMKVPVHVQAFAQGPVFD